MLKRTSTKSQSELIGLAIIVVLIVIGLLVVVSFSLRSTSTDYVILHQHQQLPVLLNDAILETHVGEDCYNEKMQHLIIRYAVGESFICENRQPIFEFINSSISTILENTLDSWFMTYRYTIYTGLDYRDEDERLFYFTNSENNCHLMSITTENFFFTMSTGEFINMKLDLCY